MYLPPNTSKFDTNTTVFGQNTTIMAPKYPNISPMYHCIFPNYHCICPKGVKSIRLMSRGCNSTSPVTKTVVKLKASWY